MQKLKPTEFFVSEYLNSEKNQLLYMGQMVYNSPNFSLPIFINTVKITEDLPADLPKFSSPFASLVMIRQNFPPPKFSHVRYQLVM